MKTIHSFILVISIFSFSFSANAGSITNGWPEVSAVKWEMKGGRLHINWNADNDAAGIYYIIEKSTDGKQFTGAGIVLGGFNQNNQFEFACRLNHQNGTQYRIIQVDNNGKSRLLDSKFF
jgi:hypothetical protein